MSDWLETLTAIAVAALTSTGLWGFLKTRRPAPPITAEKVSAAAGQAQRDADHARQVQRVDALWDLVHDLRDEVDDLRAEVEKSRSEAEQARAETGLVHAHVLELRDTLDNPPPWPPGYPAHLPREGTPS
ncbi:MAG: hypothetical protein Q4G35_03210 [Propionibacteriaceae bacterium]|nr:hypothetical protein [Propionibacteriaceae bacterium]